MNAKSIELTDAQLQERNAALQLKIQQSKRYPHVYGEGNLQRNLIIPVTPVPSIAFNPDAAPSEITPLRFATNWSARAGIQASWDIFNPKHSAAIEEAKYQQSQATLQAAISQQSLTNNIIDHHAQVLIAREQEKISKQILDNYSNTYKILQLRYEAGRIDKIELNNALQQVNELKQLALEAHSLVLDKQLLLAQWVDYDFNSDFSTSLQDIYEKECIRSNYELDILQEEKNFNLYQQSKIKWKALPTINLNAYYGANYFNNDFKLHQSQHW